MLRIATRSSPLALYQATQVATELGGATELVQVTTTGDKQRDLPIDQLAGQGVFVVEVQAAVLEGRADIATHSAKDMRSTPTEGLTLVGFLKRGDVRDALVGSSLTDLASGATVATGSVRRKVQLANLRPDLNFVGLRGNIATRLAATEKEDIDAVVVAMAALERLELTHHCAEVLSTELVLPQAGQGAIAVECREDDHKTKSALEGIVDYTTTICVTAERALLAGFGGGCDLPVGALATWRDDTSKATLEMTAMLASLDGKQVLTAKDSITTKDSIVLGHPSSATPAIKLGAELARHLLEDLGGAALLGHE